MKSDLENVNMSLDGNTFVSTNNTSNTPHMICTYNILLIY